VLSNIVLVIKLGAKIKLNNVINITDIKSQFSINYSFFYSLHLIKLI
jgi:hypothetical protein